MMNLGILRLSFTKSPHGSGGEFAAQQEPTALPLFHDTPSARPHLTNK